MSAIKVGRIVVKTMGREAGNRAVIVKLIDRNFALITGAGISPIKRRRANINHIEPTATDIEIEADANDKAVAAAVKANSEAKALLSKKLEY